MFIGNGKSSLIGSIFHSYVKLLEGTPNVKLHHEVPHKNCNSVLPFLCLDSSKWLVTLNWLTDTNIGASLVGFSFSNTVDSTIWYPCKKIVSPVSTVSPNSQCWGKKQTIFAPIPRCQKQQWCRPVPGSSHFSFHRPVKGKEIWVRPEIR